MGAYGEVLRRNIHPLFAEGSHEALHHLLWVFALGVRYEINVPFWKPPLTHIKFLPREQGFEIGNGKNHSLSLNLEEGRGEGFIYFFVHGFYLLAPVGLGFFDGVFDSAFVEGEEEELDFRGAIAKASLV